MNLCWALSDSQQAVADMPDASKRPRRNERKALSREAHTTYDVW